ncbi:vasopressin V2 receptor [Brachionichthys hirsutus]|uniref:vasopressin V2 receptor n=1 Tax=Brachionichthys hirsutus TaxID=412623 RepID=UPI00360522BB
MSIICLSGLESIGLEMDFVGLSHSTLVTTGRNNFSSPSLFVSDLTSHNSSNSDGSFFSIFPENGSTTTSTPQTLPQPRVRDPGLAQAEIAILGVMLALTTLGNSFVLWVLLRRRKQNAPMHVFMVNLCVADLVVAFFQVLPQLIWDITERFQGPDLLCRSVKYLQIVGMFASSYMIVAMTVDRHHAICCPLQAYRGGAMSRWNPPVMVAWGLALIFSIPQVFIFSRSEVAPGMYECWGNFVEPWGLKAYITWMTMAVFILPALIITICQIRIFREIHNNIYLKSERMMMTELKKKKKTTPLSPPPPGITNAMSKTVKMTLVIVLAYTICWSPFFIVQLWRAWDPNPPDHGVAFTLLMLLASLNSCTNPWIYTAFSNSVSRELQNLLRCRLRPSRRGSVPDDSTTVTHTSTTKDNLY